MNTVSAGGLCFGAGLPRIFVPLVSGNMPELLHEIQAVRDLPADLYEWRMDGFFGSFSTALQELRRGLPGRPLLCTLRTVGEGGRCDLSPEGYETFLSALLDTAPPELIDVELACGEERVRRLADKARRLGVGVIVSRHHFLSTPPEEEMADTLRRMKALGADLPKLAVMPGRAEDVLALMRATLAASREIGPVITMSMGALGKLSRVSGMLTGSCVTFGAGENASAPGQINTEDLRAILEDLS